MPELHSLKPQSLQIEKLTYGGDGLARLPGDAKGRRMAVFVPFTLPGEQVETTVLPQKGGMARAELRRVISPAPERVTPPCPYFGACGGCQLQHGSYELQLQAKRGILRETFDRAKLNLPVEIASLANSPWRYRNRIRLHVRAKPHWQVGYLERRSHRFLPITTCPIAAPLLEHALSVFANPAISSLAPDRLTEIELFCNHDRSELTIAAWTADATPGLTAQFRRWIAAIQAAVPQLRGAVALTQRNEHSGPAVIAESGGPSLTYSVAGGSYLVSASAFFQVNMHLLDSLVEHVAAAVSPTSGQHILDLYSGVGLFSLPLARAGVHITAVESSPMSARDLAQNLQPFANAKAVRESTERFLAKTKRTPDAILLDPPRAGLGAEVTRHLARIAPPRLVYLSCDPATLARDLQPLLASGYAVEHITMIDMFPQTYHIETLILLRR